MSIELGNTELRKIRLGVQGTCLDAQGPGFSPNNCKTNSSGKPNLVYVVTVVSYTRVKGGSATVVTLPRLFKMASNALDTQQALKVLMMTRNITGDYT